MEVKTYRAKSLQQALQLVRRDLGPEAAVLHTREVGGRLLGLFGGRQIEVTASCDVHVPSRFAPEDSEWSEQDDSDYDDEDSAEVNLAEENLAEENLAEENLAEENLAEEDSLEEPSDEPDAAHEVDYRGKFRRDLKGQLNDLQSMVEELCHRSEPGVSTGLTGPFLALLGDLLDADVQEEQARELLARLRTRVGPDGGGDLALLKARLARMLEEEFVCSGPICAAAGGHRLVALVGPTGVGKTTTIAKLAAQFHLREKRRVGLITVDTYRIAAVDQLRTYADIIDLPMEVVATPREMRDAVAKLSDLELVLMDTAGRSPSDEIKILELRALLAEARADEVHLVLSSVASPSSIRNAVEQFAGVGVTSLLLTKLDEATGIGSLLPLLRGGRFPLSYLTMGQNVPDDLAPADARRLARHILRLDGGQ